MSSSSFRLESVWHTDTADSGKFEFTLFNVGTVPLNDFRLVFSSLTRAVPGHECVNATLLQRFANYHEFAPASGSQIEPGGMWRFELRGVTRAPTHCTDGPKSAYILLPDNTTLPVDCGDLLLAGAPSSGVLKSVPEGSVLEPYAITPWPRSLALSGNCPAPTMIYAHSSSVAADKRALSSVNELARRLFPGEPAWFSLVPAADGLAIDFDHVVDLGNEAYRLVFRLDGITLASGGEAGRVYGLITLAQMMRGARHDPKNFNFPMEGQIEDEPRFGWRGCHLDVSRHFYDMARVTRFVDILAWNKLNIFHWHLSDDEGWRLEIKGLPELTTVGARRGHAEKMLPQHAGGAETVDGFYTQDDVRKLIAHAQAINVEIVPEIDVPGHCNCVLAAYPELADGQEAPDSYQSIQGYPNNAINPAKPETYAFLETVFGEIAALFPSEYIHIGGDEVADGSWLGSPLARKMMDEHEISTTAQLQSVFMRRVKEILSAKGKKLAGWDEVSHGGGVDPDDTLLMAWQKPEIGLDLAKQGYDVVMTPGQAYYLDMAQGTGFEEPGLTWAGTVPVEHTYLYEAAAEFPPELAHKLLGVQGCIWSENLVSLGLINHMVFPRLSAIAEAAWTVRENKDWKRFCALSKLMPQL